MQPFVTVSGRAAAFLAPNIDTDVIMPKTFLKGVDRKGLDVGVFNLLRFTDGVPNPDFILNRPGYAGTKFLIVGPNFGCGSSREHAVWGLQQLGILALIGTSFAGIFNDNCRNNGVLSLCLAPAQVALLAERVSAPNANMLTIDLEAQRISIEATGEAVAFDIEQSRKEMLLKGLDVVAATLQYAADIRTFEARHRQASPWFF
ncbi:MAG: 3-isopropylmalate/(R)-2-methylmalate dehydratase small subunit [Hyphomicrobiales bacterium]